MHRKAAGTEAPKSKEMWTSNRGPSPECSSGSTFEKHGKYAPAASFFVGLATLCGIFVSASTSGHIPAGMWWPIISLLGYLPPDRYVYAVGFSATGLGIVASAVYGDTVVLSLVEARHRRLAKVAYVAALVAAVGLVGQATIPLQVRSRINSVWKNRENVC
jgi:hypothetical protein